MSVKPVLYSRWHSSCSWRVRIALNLKEIDYEYKTVTLRSGETLEDPEYLKVNPTRKVPALVEDGKAITESLAIIEYLDERYPDRFPLLPKEPARRAQARAVALHICANIQPIQNIRVLNYVNRQKEGEGVQWAHYWVLDGLRDLEGLLEQTAGKFAVGDEVTIADLCVPSIVYKARKFDVDLSAFPILSRIDETLALIPQFSAAHADRQPDAPKAENPR